MTQVISEAVRLVIWDLDETFWRGTLTEGGIEYVQAHHEIVETLARRGIVSAICSKNDIASVRDLLAERGLWDSFVFPSIDWTSKGPRLAAMIEAIGLRPPTVLFIDDNPMNRNEALHFVPGIQVADETLVPGLLDDPRLRGKDDSKLTRLAQYKLLETRHADMASSPDTSDFLRSSNIRVTFEHDVEAHLDRAIELVNRTNQLNFTKVRMSDDLDTARAEMRALLGQANMQAGLVRVTDNYGDYGFVGFYAVRVHSGMMAHFCFSCRTLGMGVERWVYGRLGKPIMTVVGEVLSDLHAATPVIDWVNAAATGPAALMPRIAGRVVIRGGCDLQAVAHYLRMVADEVVEEFPFERHGRPMRLDHSQVLLYAMDGMTPAQRDAARAIGHVDADFESALAGPGSPPAAVLLSFQSDKLLATYQHRESGFTTQFGVPRGHSGGDVRTTDPASLEGRFSHPTAFEHLTTLRAEYDYAAPSIEPSMERVARVVSRIPAQTRVLVLENIEIDYAAPGGPALNRYDVAFNVALRNAVRPFTNAETIPLDPMLHGPEDVVDRLHYRRLVYFRIYEWIMARLTAPGVMETATVKAARAA